MDLCDMDVTVKKKYKYSITSKLNKPGADKNPIECDSILEEALNMICDNKFSVIKTKPGLDAGLTIRCNPIYISYELRLGFLAQTKNCRTKPELKNYKCISVPYDMIIGEPIHLKTYLYEKIKSQSEEKKIYFKFNIDSINNNILHYWPTKSETLQGQKELDKILAANRYTIENKYEKYRSPYLRIKLLCKNKHKINISMNRINDIGLSCNYCTFKKIHTLKTLQEWVAQFNKKIIVTDIINSRKAGLSTVEFHIGSITYASLYKDFVKLVNDV